ncbi:MAG: hypothetical protein OXH69_14995 [Acidobacteria bacterium]|nr:hypothetical protein [Acidobacteriota bacterium]
MVLPTTCDSFQAAGAPDDKAREAAGEIAGFQDRLAGFESDVDSSMDDRLQPGSVHGHRGALVARARDLTDRDAPSSGR